MSGTRPRRGTRQLLRTGALAGVGAAVCTTAAAAAARAADVGLEVDGTAIPVGAFTMWTIVGAGLGIVLAAVLRDRRRFVLVAVTLTALSLLPAVIAPDDTTTSVVLVGTHLLAAAVVVPALARTLSDRTLSDRATDR